MQAWGNSTRVEAVDGVVELDSGTDVLAYVRAQRAAANTAEVEILRAVVAWAEQHPPESIDHAATWPGTEDELMLAGEGAPLVAEFCIAELAAALNLTTDAGRQLVADALELKYRLPRVWARVLAGDLPTWRARRIARQTVVLSQEAAAHVDRQAARVAHRIGPLQLERLVQAAIEQFMPETARENAAKAAEGRHVAIHHQQVTFNGTTYMTAELDLADALDFDAAISRGAEQLEAAGCDDPLDVRRAKAVGDMARRQLALELNGSGDDGESRREGDVGVAGRTRPVKPRQVVLYVHLAEAAISGTCIDPDSARGAELHLARVENRQQGVTADQVKAWCANPDTQVTVKPVIDLNDHIRVDAYEIPDRLREQTVLRDGMCVYPWCTRPARSCDVDHPVPHATGGQTASDNAAPLCRRHHRLKTHSSWNYTVLEPGTYLWSSPHGYQFLRDHLGTLDVSRDRRHPVLGVTERHI